VELDFPALTTDNRDMEIRGRVENGVVVPVPGASLPEGAEVVVSVCAVSSDAGDEWPEAERQRAAQLMDHIASLPDENPDDRFSGADHDKVLYGKP
jgi:tellurite resistance protein